MKAHSSKYATVQNRLEMLQYDDQYMSSAEQQNLVRMTIMMEQIKEEFARDEERFKELEGFQKKQNDEVSANIQNYIQPLFRIAYAIFNHSKGGKSL